MCYTLFGTTTIVWILVTTIALALEETNHSVRINDMTSKFLHLWVAIGIILVILWNISVWF